MLQVFKVKSLLALFNKLLTDEYQSFSLWLIISFIFGIALYFTLPIELEIWQFLAFLPILMVIFLYQKGNFLEKLVFLILLSFYLGMVVGKVRYLTIDPQQINFALKSRVSGIVKTITPSSNSVMLTVSNSYIDMLNNSNKLLNIKVIASKKHARDVMVGDYVSFSATLNSPVRSILAGGYDFNMFTYFKEISAIGYVFSSIKILDNSEKKNLAAKIQYVRMKIYNRIINVLGDFLGSFVNAILLGETRALDKEITLNMRRAGVSHILCISGLHLSMVAVIFFVGSRFVLNLFDVISFNYDVKVIAAIISLIGSFGYLILAGMQIAAVRAFIMTAIFIWAIIINRTPVPLRSVGLAAIIILVINPEYVLHPSFQLSFIAVISLIFGYDFYNKWQKSRASNILSKVKFLLLSNIYSTIVASFATTPVAIYHFYSFANYSVLSNLLIVPLMTFWVMPLALVALLLIPLNLDSYFFILVGYGVDAIIKVAGIVARLPAAVTYIGHVDGIALVIYLFGFFGLVILSKGLKLIGIGIIMFAIMLIVSVPKPDIIFDGKIPAIGVKNNEGKLEIYAARMSEFAKNYWSNWYGQNEVLFHKIPITKSNHKFVTDSGKVITIRFKEEECYDSDMTITTIDQDKCRVRNLVNVSTFNKFNVVQIFCNIRKCEYKIRVKNRFYVEKS